MGLSLLYLSSKNSALSAKQIFMFSIKLHTQGKESSHWLNERSVILLVSKTPKAADFCLWPTEWKVIYLYALFYGQHMSKVLV